MTDPVAIDSSRVIDVLREQLADAHWQVTILRAQVAQLTAQPADPPATAQPADPPADTID